MRGTAIKRLLWYISSLLVLLSCSWFALMEFILHRPGFTMRAIIALLIVQYALLCLRYTNSSSHAARVRHILTFSALVTLALSLYVFCANLRSTHFEGYILLIALALITQSLLTIAGTLHRPRLHPA